MFSSGKVMYLQTELSLTQQLLINFDFNSTITFNSATFFQSFTPGYQPVLHQVFSHAVVLHAG